MCGLFAMCTFRLILLYLFGFEYVLCRMYPEQVFYPGLYDDSQSNKIQIALDKLDHAPKWESEWPDPSVKLGQVSGVALNQDGTVFVFHRASNVWDENTFNLRNVYQAIGEPPITHPTVYMLNDTGEIVDVWGQNLFYMPHGITVDLKGNVWLTDVALHQVFKFTPDDRQKPALVLGEKFVPGSDNEHFCKPSAVAVLSTGDFFVADGYCNTRIVKYAPDGTRLLQWGRSNIGEPNSPYGFNVPLALTLAEDRGLVCTADRENGRVGCFRSDNGTFVASYRSWLFGSRVFSVAYAPVQGGRLYVINGADGRARVRGYVVEFDSGRLIGTFAPQTDFSNPHDVVASPDGSRVYVAELNPYRVHKFSDDSINATSVGRRAPATMQRAKPTATVEISGGAHAPWEWWRGAVLGAGGALAAAAAVLVVVAALRRERGETLPDRTPLMDTRTH